MTSQAHVSRTQFKAFQKLLLKKERQAEGKFIVEGSHLIDEALGAKWHVDVILANPEIAAGRLEEISRRAHPRKVPILNITEKELNLLSDAVTSQGLLAVVNMPARKIMLPTAAGDRSVIVALDAVTDPGNLGTILRTCDWFGVDAVLVGKGSVDLFNPKVVRSTMGALFHLPVSWDVDLAEFVGTAAESGYAIVATTLENGTSLERWHFPEKCLLLFGNEAHGVSREILRTSTDRITIPKFGKAESLNVAISCGIILASLRLRS